MTDVANIVAIISFVVVAPTLPTVNGQSETLVVIDIVIDIKILCPVYLPAGHPENVTADAHSQDAPYSRTRLD